MLVPALLVALAAPPAAGETPIRWGPVGHRAIAMVASDQLTPAARRAVTALLSRESLADASTWPDSIRRDRPETAPWHYVNISVLDSVYRPERHCPDRCIIEAIDRQVAILADRRRSDADRRDALRWVAHLVGDLHMPLHAADRGDRGGGDVRLTFEGRRYSLHGLWDSGLIDALGHDDASLAAAIRDDLRQHGDRAVMARGDVVAWAMESHAISRNLVYHALPQSLELDRGYLDIVRPALRLQLVRASVRLAAVLNRALGEG
mgnify:CR=1 FL=1